MRKVTPTLLLRLALLVAVFASAVLVVEYGNGGAPEFCGVGSGCMAVRLSAYSKIGDVPLPVIGLSAHAGLLALVLIARKKGHTAVVAAAAVTGGVIALGLLYLQANEIGAFCPWCLVVDVSSMVAAVAAGLVYRQHSRGEPCQVWRATPSRERAQRVAWTAGAAIVAGLPFVWSAHRPLPPVPPGVAALAVTGQVTIVSFTDFECPFCRKLHPVLNRIQRRWGDRIAIVRKMAPLPGHPGAMPAALAYLCAPEPRREEMAHELYTVASELLTREGTLVFADDLKLDKTAFARCVDAPATRQAVESDLALFASLGLGVLPYTYIGPHAVAGYDPVAVRELGRLAMKGDRLSLPVPWLFAAVGLVALLLVAVTLRAASTSAREPLVMRVTSRVT